METFTIHKGVVAILDRNDIDTDQIIPKQFLKKIERKGFGVNLFHDWRYLDTEGKQINPNFELNKKIYQGASILLTGENFGCGSSREHAPWSLQEYGFRAIIAPSFADIFYNNCFKIGLLSIPLPRVAVRSIINWVEANASNNKKTKLSINLEKQSISLENSESYNFEISSFHKENIMQGRDEIANTLTHEKEIREFEIKHSKNNPFLRIK